MILPYSRRNYPDKGMVLERYERFLGGGRKVG